MYEGRERNVFKREKGLWPECMIANDRVFALHVADVGLIFDTDLIPRVH